MNPHQKNKVDINSLSPDEQRLFRLYGKLPSKSDHLAKHLKERKYFDSGDYALSKAGKASDIGVTSIGREHPVPEKIPHIAPPAQNGHSQNSQDKGQSGGSPVKENSFLHRETSLNRETSVDDIETEEEGSNKA